MPTTKIEAAYREKVKNFLVEHPNGNIEDLQTQNPSNDITDPNPQNNIGSDNGNNLTGENILNPPLNLPDSTTINKPRIGGGNDGNVATPLPVITYGQVQYPEGTTAKDARKRSYEKTTTIPGSGQGGTGVGYAESFAKLTPAQKKEYGTPDLPSWTRYVIDYNKNQNASSSTETITQDRDMWTKEFASWDDKRKYMMTEGGYNWKWLVEKINTKGDTKHNFTVEQFKAKFNEVGYDKFQATIKRLYGYIYKGGTGGGGGSSSGLGGWY